MLCSGCSQNVRPIVAVDIDGTLGDYHGHFINFAENYFGLDCCYHSNYVGRERFSEWCQENFHISLEQYREAKLAYRQGGMKRSMPIFDFARELCWEIRKADAELWLTTTRPYLSLDGVVKDTYAWLERHEIVCDGLLFDDDKYKKLAERVDRRRVVAIFDDLMEFISPAKKIFGSHIPILVVGKYNSACTGQLYCQLESAASVARYRIQRWREIHA